MFGKRPRAAAGLRRGAVAIAWVACAFVWPDPAGALQWTRVVGTGDLAPGFDDGARIGRVVRVAPHLADDGTIAFLASAGEGSSFPQPVTVLYRRAPGASPERLALASDLLFGSNQFASIDELRVNGRGDVLFLGLRPGAPSSCADGEGPVRREFAMVYERDGSHRTVAETFLPVPGLAAEWVGGLSCSLARPRRCPPSITTPSPLIAEDGGVVLLGDIAQDACTASPFRGIFGPDGAGFEQLVALAGEPAPGAPIGVRFGSRFQWSHRSLNAAGQLAVRAVLDDASEAIYRWDPNVGPTLIARTGAAFDVAGGVNFERLGKPTLAADGTPAFLAGEGEPSRGPIGFPDGVRHFDAVWGPDGGGGLRRLLSFGDPVPGAPEGSTFADFRATFSLGALLLESDEPPLVDAAGRVAVALPIDIPGVGIVRAVLGPDEQGTFRVRMLASGPAPGIPGQSLRSLDVLALSDDGRLLVRAFVFPDGASTPTETVWYRLEPTGEALLLLRASAPLELVPGEFAPVGDSAALSLHANGDLSAFAVLASNPDPAAPSALFVAEVPEPGGLAASATALSALGGVARRRQRRLRCSREATASFRTR